jgi:hypothetical protein
VGPGLHEDGFGFGPEDEVDSAEGFAAWVGKRLRLTHAAGEPCLADTVASARTIERNGGVLVGIRDGEHGPVRRYWIALDR